MEGCQHNTMDVEYYGPNPQMDRLVSRRPAGRRGDGPIPRARPLLPDTCRRLFERGRQWTDEHLFNGEYYEQRDPSAPERSGYRGGPEAGHGRDGCRQPRLPIGFGLPGGPTRGSDVAHVCGLGHLLNPAHVQTTLRSIMRYNSREGFHDHFNCLRSFVLGDESALLMASYPQGGGRRTRSHTSRR